MTSREEKQLMEAIELGTYSLKKRIKDLEDLVKEKNEIIDQQKGLISAMKEAYEDSLSRKDE